jgi:hypothetical protein
MSINRNTWSPEERKEYDNVLARVVGCSKNTPDRLDLFERLLNDAIQAHRMWARDVERAIRRDGLGAEIRRYQDRNRAMVSYNGEVLNLPRVQSTKVRKPTGEVVYQRELIELCTWDQLAEKRREALHSKATYSAKVAHYDKLLALHDLCPEAKTPAEAAAKLEITVDGWLAGVIRKAA